MGHSAQRRKLLSAEGYRLMAAESFIMVIQKPPLFKIN
jgi:hypothetical protein